MTPEDPFAQSHDTERKGHYGSGAESRARIARAAQEFFMKNGFLETSVREIAREAGVDAALVIRYFGSKEQLFLETIAMAGYLDVAVEGPLEGMGERLVWLILEGERGLIHFSALMRASDKEGVREYLAAAVELQLVRPLAPRLTAPDAELRAHLVAAQIIGLLAMLGILHDESLIHSDAEHLAALYGKAIQVLIDGNPQA
jgi:AcrR family transcriptional regulator